MFNLFNKRCECGQERTCSAIKKLKIVGDGVATIPSSAYLECGKVKKIIKLSSLLKDV
jgi:hypothetical protein